MPAARPCRVSMRSSDLRERRFRSAGDDVSSQSPTAIVGRYVLYGEIASGGMASVHLGRLVGDEGFARTVAIKRLHAHLAKNAEFVSMLRDEARLASRIRHPNVVATLDVARSDDDLVLVMEYVQGESLAGALEAARKR